MQKNGQKKCYKYFFCFKQISRCDIYFHIHFIKDFSKLRCVAFDFFYTYFLPPEPYPNPMRKKTLQISFKFLFNKRLKVSRIKQGPAHFTIIFEDNCFLV